MWDRCPHCGGWRRIGFGLGGFGLGLGLGYLAGGGWGPGWGPGWGHGGWGWSTNKRPG